MRLIFPKKEIKITNMNYLAHLFLSGENEDLLIGNFIADFIKNKEVSQYNGEVQKGVFLHRKIDTYTDNHAIVRQSTRRLQAHHRKYAPVVVDILYDHLLVHNWTKYSSTPLSDYTKWVYDILENRLLELPPKLQKRIPIMIEHDWLQAYGTKKGLRYTFERMDERTRFPSNFVDAVAHLYQDYEAFDKEFNTFFPDLIAKCGVRD